MADEKTAPSGPDLTLGITLTEFTGDTLLGHVGDEDVLLARAGAEIFAIDAHCSHYHGPLAEGLVVGEGIRCPWHHACFDLRSGEAARAPALNTLQVWQVARTGDRILVKQKREQPKPRITGPIDAPDRIVIIGGGAAGFAAAEMLMDYLKTRAPFWKRATRIDGAVEGWVEAKSEDQKSAARWNAAD